MIALPVGSVNVTGMSLGPLRKLMYSEVIVFLIHLGLLYYTSFQLDE